MEFKSNRNIFLAKAELNENSFDFIINSFQALFGDCEATKCLVDENDSNQITFTQCSCLILNELNIFNQSNSSNVAGYLSFYQSSISSFHKFHVCSSKTLVCFSSLLWKHLKHSISSNRLSSSKLSCHLMSIYNEIVKLVKHNRLLHLNNWSNQPAPDFIYLQSIINGICRNHIIISDLMWQLVLYHKRANILFNYENIHILNQVNTSAMNENEKKQLDFKIVPGLVIKLDSQSNLTVFKQLITREKYLKCLLIDASLVHNYAFLGFNKNLESFKYFNQNTNNNKQDAMSSVQIWQRNAQSIIKQNKIQAVFIKDKIDKNLMQFCANNSILVFNNLTNNFLKQLVNTFECKSLSFIENITEENIFTIEEFHLIDNIYFNMKNNRKTLNFTILIETRIQSTLNLFTEYLNHCIRRVHNIMVNSEYLLGNGDLEYYLYEELNKPNEQIDSLISNDNDFMIYFNIVREAFKNTFRDMNLIITKNTQISNSNPTYDDFTSKMDALKTACLINKFFLNTNLAIRL